ncbi:MAG: YybS family protein [Deltaproteobacteria bacterium]|nr:YybS family protein [Deltaproteobacteria bacterium]
MFSFLLFLFIINSIYEGIYSFINPFFYIYYGITLILLFSIVGSASAINIILSIVIAVGFLINGGTVNFSGYFSHAAFGRFFISVIIIQFLVFIVIPYIFSYLISKGSGVTKSIYIPVSAVFAVSFFIGAVYISAGKINILPSLNYLSADMTGKLITEYNKMGMTYFTTLKMRVLISKLLKIILLLLPAILIIFSWMSIWISFIFLKRISKKNNVFFNGVKENLLLWRSSDYFLLFLILGILISVFSIGIFKYIGYNIILLSSSVYLVQGLTILSFFFNKFNVNIFLRILGYGIIFILSNPIIILVIMTGIFDMWFNFRKIETKKEANLI